VKRDSKRPFGDFAKRTRLSKGLGLRQAARDMGVQAAYLSRVESGTEPPSGRLIARMSELYGTSIEELTQHAATPRASAAAHGHAVQASPELRALYRLAAQLDSDMIETIIRRALGEKGASEKEIEKQLAALKSELPRVANSTRDGLFAAEATPRFLTRARITEIAYNLLERHGQGQGRYKPPTPIERIVDLEPEIHYRIEALKCDKRGNPLVLGLTGWGEDGRRQIVVNGKLADSRRACDVHRFNFTVAHELFHAIEHLPRVPKDEPLQLAREGFFVDSDHDAHGSLAERAVDQWSRATQPRRLTTHEQWREWQANTFASAILMPDWAVTASFRKRISSESIFVKSSHDLRSTALQIAGERAFAPKVYDQSLAELFAVSRQAMAIRLLQLNLVQEATG
jgi:transcriptional regulator with XRE-family HTH domain